MKKCLIRLTLLASALIVTTACGVERKTTVLGPTTGHVTAAGTGPSPASQSMIGTWISARGVSTETMTGPPIASSCVNSQWSISSQTATQVAGRFTALCPGGLHVGGAIAATLGGSTVRLVFTGTATRGTTTRNADTQGADDCALALNGTGIWLGTDTLRIDYTGQSCLGPILGSEALRLASAMPAAPFALQER